MFRVMYGVVYEDITSTTTDNLLRIREKNPKLYQA